MIIRWEKGQDYYLVHVHQDMFGDWLVTRVWGLTGTQYGGIKHTLVNSPEEAAILVDDVRHIQESRGFQKILEARDPDEIPPELQSKMKSELPFND
ncbi:WGR domain-containing protein [Marinospirillum perlucidum]|uniref:WGR domain-containing protein n=1 Tax=Marinospirillum perlucidum TaxID=1982602 RepID=UPI000DF26F51|nr:WGR domain-containing protein [Marinospirillum perlucidum]